jgi:hypothetical protein
MSNQDWILYNLLKTQININEVKNQLFKSQRKYMLKGKMTLQDWILDKLNAPVNIQGSDVSKEQALGKLFMNDHHPTNTPNGRVSLFVP